MGISNQVMVAFVTEFEKLAANPASNPFKMKDFAQSAKKAIGRHLGAGAEKLTESLSEAGPYTRAAFAGGAAGAIPGAVSGLFDNRGNPTVGKRVKRSLKRGAQWGVSGAGLAALHHYIRFNHLGE